jgi:hypothetical protein
MKNNISISMIKLFIPAVMVFCSLTAVADDYVVSIKNDTLRGKIEIQTYGTIDRVQVVSVDKKKTILTAIQVATVSLNNEIYSPVRTNYGFRFMKLVKPGFVSLYMGRRATSPTDSGFYYDVEFLVKKDGSSMEVSGMSFKRSISNFLSECAVIKNRIDKEDLGRKDLDRILTMFNTCIEDQTHASKALPPVGNDDQRMVMLKGLRTKIEVSSLSAKKDAVDIVNDMVGKVEHNQNIPNYQLDGLKNILKDSPDLAADFEKIVPLLNKS